MALWPVTLRLDGGGGGGGSGGVGGGAFAGCHVVSSRADSLFKLPSVAS